MSLLSWRDVASLAITVIDRAQGFVTQRVSCPGPGGGVFGVRMPGALFPYNNKPATLGDEHDACNGRDERGGDDTNQADTHADIDRCRKDIPACFILDD